MATRKAAGTAKNLTDSNPQYLGVKKHDGEVVSAGNIILKQRGSKYIAGKNTKYGKDYTIFAMTEGKVKFGNKRHMNFDNTWKVKKIVTVEK
jgi:large subunit ribosomal protein L27